MREQKTKRGVTLIETVIAIFIATIIMLGFTVLFARIWKSYGFTLETGVATHIASRGVQGAVEHMRKAQPSENGSFPVVSATHNEFSFYADYDDDAEVERIRYFIEDQQLKMNVVEPDFGVQPVAYTGSGSTFTMADDVVNSVVTGSSSCTQYQIISDIDGTSGNPFTDLGMAHGIGGAGEYFFNLNGQAFRTQVENDGWVLVAGGRRDRDTYGLSQRTRVRYSSDEILPQAAVSQFSGVEAVQISSSVGQYSPFEVTTTDAGVISRLLSYETLGYDTAHNALWVGDTDGRMTINNNNGASQSLHQQLYYASGNNSGMHWIPSTVAPGTADDRREQVSRSSRCRFWNCSNNLNLLVRAAPVSATFSVIATRQPDNSFLGDNNISYTEAALQAQGALCIAADDAVEKPIFEYYDDFEDDIALLNDAGEDFGYYHVPTTALSTPVNVQDIRLVRIVLHVNPRPTHAPENIQIQSFATLRNLLNYDEPF